MFFLLTYSQEPGGCACNGVSEPGSPKMSKRSKGSTLRREEEVPSVSQPGNPPHLLEGHFLRAEGRANTLVASRDRLGSVQSFLPPLP